MYSSLEKTKIALFVYADILYNERNSNWDWCEHLFVLLKLSAFFLLYASTACDEGFLLKVSYYPINVLLYMYIFIGSTSFVQFDEFDIGQYMGSFILTTNTSNEAGVVFKKDLIQ
ncbi:hypothetical protein CHS0354_034000 [Potamilus streckersoni]|uniref:Uncharacterized protein n=1 Tax=Potamilus streckersoni TaxID=2493646 RepID=A0AAE0RNC4_9BIVA|nr:hypothetical protein CHS0354_034000 [Potamilus streckersoni]